MTLLYDDDDDAPLAIAGDQVNRECYMQVGGRTKPARVASRGGKRCNVN